MNVRDSEAVGALLDAAGHERVQEEGDAELVIVNSCTVRDMAERKAIGKCGNLIAVKEGRGKASEGGKVQLVIDSDLLKDEFIGCHPCINTSTLKIKTADIIEKFLPEVGHEYAVVELPWEVE